MHAKNILLLWPRPSAASIIITTTTPPVLSPWLRRSGRLYGLVGFFLHLSYKNSSKQQTEKNCTPHTIMLHLHSVQHPPHLSRRYCCRFWEGSHTHTHTHIKHLNCTILAFSAKLVRSIFLSYLPHLCLLSFQLFKLSLVFSNPFKI